MKYAILTDNDVQWFTYIVSILDTGECVEAHSLDAGINNDYLSNIFYRELSFSNLRLAIFGQISDTWYGNWISKYDFERIKKLIELYPKVKEYQRLGKLE